MARGTVDIRALKRQHAKLLAGIGSAVRETLDGAGKHAREHVQTKSAFKRRTAQGRSAKDLTKYRIVRIRGGKMVRISNNRTSKGFNVSAALEHGTKPHTIWASSDKVLRFKVNGQWLFRRSVNHPGTKPYKFLFKAVKDAHRQLGPRLQARLNELARRF